VKKRKGKGIKLDQLQGTHSIGGYTQYRNNVPKEARILQTCQMGSASLCYNKHLSDAKLPAMTLRDSQGCQERFQVLLKHVFRYCTFSPAIWHLLPILEEDQGRKTKDIVFFNQLRIGIMINFDDLYSPIIFLFHQIFGYKSWQKKRFKVALLLLKKE
jgi:hypothetical protein